MATAGMRGATGVGAVALAVVVALQALVLPDTYSSTQPGIIGFIAVLLGIVLTTTTSVRAIMASQGSAGVVRLAGPTIPLLYTLASAGAWLAAPLLSETLAYAVHLLLVGVVAVSLVSLGALSGYVQASDEASDSASAGRNAMLSAAQNAKRKITSESAEAMRTALHAVMEMITYADRNGCAETVAIEGAIVAGLEQLSLTSADEVTDLTLIADIERRLAERRDVLRARK
jgi:uncharacterized membrane protein